MAIEQSLHVQTTAAQRAEVMRLHDEGGSVRGIAVEVFGHERFRGRVERIVAAARSGAAPAGARSGFEPFDVRGLSDTEVLRRLFEWRLERWAARGVAPSMRELQAMLAVQRQLAASDQVERLRRRPWRSPEAADG
jgi:hypothetical protein